MAVIRKHDENYLNQQFLNKFDSVTTVGLLLTLVLIFIFQSEVVLKNPIHIILIAIPLIIQTFLIFGIAYVACYLLKLSHNIAAHAGMIGASNFFELAVAVAIALFGTTSGAALAVEDNYIRQNISDNLLKELRSSHHYEDAHRRALNNTSYVHPDTKKKIFKAVEQLSYRSNLLAKGLKQGIGVLRVLKESGKKVPEEVMVISLTGHAIGGMIETAMTSMELPGREMGQWAADMILEDIEAEK